MVKYYYFYIMASKNNTVLYTGITNNIIRRVFEHRQGYGSVFTKKYHVEKLVYYEQTEDITAAIQREKQIKGGSRQKKIDLVTQMNASWDDLAERI